MAAQALGPGTTIVRRRAFFGLLDAGGWAWATLKAAFWFVTIIMLTLVGGVAYLMVILAELRVLHYMPKRAAGGI